MEINIVTDLAPSVRRSLIDIYYWAAGRLMVMKRLDTCKPS
jgi:hypothetical protein